jgi:tetratricopeptide (TPR) repeat protein
MRVSVLFLLLFTVLAAAEPPASESLADRGLRLLLERQQSLFAEAREQGEKLDRENFQNRVQELVRDYEIYLRGNPNSADGHAAYGYLLGKVDMRREALVMLMKANRLNPEIPLVKNQLGNLLAEAGKPLEAVSYYIAAIRLAPQEPLYHYQLGTLLAEARDDFLQSGEWTRDSIEHSMHEAFKQAHTLAPDRFEFAYRYAESFYDQASPDWDAALRLWTELEAKAETPIERETMRLHAANILIKQGKTDHARIALAMVTEPELQAQKQKLVAQLPAPGDK